MIKKLLFILTLFCLLGFTPPTAEYTPDAYDVLLIHAGEADGSTTPDDASTSNHTIACVGNAQVDTAQHAFAADTGSILFDGDGDWLTVGANGDADFDFGSGNFTIDMWIRASVLGENNGIFSLTGTSTEVIDIDLETNNKLFFTIVGTSYGSGTGTAISQDTWYHIAIVRNGNNISCYKTGTSILSLDCTGQTYSSGAVRPFIGTYYSPGRYDFKGWIDEVRIGKGIARDWITYRGQVIIIQSMANFINDLNPEKIGTSGWSCKIKVMCWWKNRRIT